MHGLEQVHSCNGDKNTEMIENIIASEFDSMSFNKIENLISREQLLANFFDKLVSKFCIERTNESWKLFQMNVTNYVILRYKREQNSDVEYEFSDSAFNALFCYCHVM